MEAAPHGAVAPRGVPRCPVVYHCSGPLHIAVLVCVAMSTGVSTCTPLNVALTVSMPLWPVVLLAVSGDSLFRIGGLAEGTRELCPTTCREYVPPLPADPGVPPHCCLVACRLETLTLLTFPLSS